RINDNNFNGSIPDFVQNWKQLKRLEMVASGLEGPIPSSISALKTLTDLRITDINFTNQPFPDLSNIVGLSRLLLRNCNISGEIPPYIWEMSNLRILDLSFNKLHGNLPNAITTETLVFIFLSGNRLTGNIPMFRKGMSVDLSYNNFSQQSSGQPACQQGMVEKLSASLYFSFFTVIWEISNNLVEKDFNIEVEAAGVAKPVTKIHNATVTNNILDIHLYWAGKGTTRIPVSGVYGPLISAISVYPNFKPRFSGGGKTKTVPIILGVVGFCLVFSALAIFWWKCYFRVQKKRQK
ncbi:hypothetical protein H0E87_009005, partial [Populus deltoides]